MENNYIISEINITKDKVNEKVRIINSFENCKKEGGLEDEEDDYKYENEEEIKKCKLIINDKMIPFSYYHIFEKEGKYEIKYLFSEYLTKTSYMFYECNSLTTIDLSNFNTQNVTNMSSMFNGCNSLTTIDLSNLNTQNVTNMCEMFYICKSLKTIDLSNFNTKNVTDMALMFFECNSLTKINLSNFNTNNVTNIMGMFNGCSTLKKLDLS